MHLKQLMNLQELDNHISRVKMELSDIPRQLEMHQSRLNTAISEEKNIQQQLELLTKDRHAKELDMKSKEEEITKLSTQLYAVKTNEQYKAIQNEIAAIKSKISELEDSILNIMDSMDQAKKLISDKKIILQQEQTKYKEIEQKFKAETNRLEGLLKEAEENRIKQLEKIEPDLLRIYTRISKRWSGSALVPVRDNVCQGCYMTLPPQITNEILKKERIVQCENCSRILYINETESVV